MSVSRGRLTKFAVCRTVSSLPTMMVSVLPVPSSLPASRMVYTPSCRSVSKAVPRSGVGVGDAVGEVSDAVDWG